jgi:tRNA(fMet)-specific endonuclease VapC
LAVAAPKQRERFNKLCQDYQIILLDDLAILEKHPKFMLILD